MEKAARLIVVQIDHISGEVLGFALERLMDLGAHNVQLIPTVTKKNRPGNIILIDTAADKEDVFADFLARELKVSGYHRIDSAHVFQEVTFLHKVIHLMINGKEVSATCRFKVVGDPSAPLSVDVEHDFLVDLQRRMQDDAAVFLSLDDLRNRIESSFRSSPEELTIALKKNERD